MDMIKSRRALFLSSTIVDLDEPRVNMWSKPNKVHVYSRFQWGRLIKLYCVCELNFEFASKLLE